VDERTTGDEASPSELGCEVCREGVYSGGQPRFVVATSGVDLLYRCDACATWWIGNERATWPASSRAARELFPDHVPRTDWDGMSDDLLSDAVVRYVWAPGSAIPGRHPDAVSDTALRTRVDAIIEAVDAIRPDAGSSDMRAWAERVIGPREFPRLDDQALAALRALLTFTWR
jgi:hypothetical protein